LVPAHAVGDDVEVVLGHHNEAVFVVLPLETHVREPAGDDAHHERARSWHRGWGLRHDIVTIEDFMAPRGCQGDAPAAAGAIRP
jgi:hypothetical protein